MAQVSLQINGYGYILGCADGEEEHLRALAADLDRRIDDIKAMAGPSGEARLLLMAALVVSDELHDMREQAKSRDGEGGAAAKSEPKSGRRLRGLAKRAETIADAAEALPLTEPAGASAAAAPDPTHAAPAEPTHPAPAQPTHATPSEPVHTPPSESPE